MDDITNTINTNNPINTNEETSIEPMVPEPTDNPETIVETPVIDAPVTETTPVVEAPTTPEATRDTAKKAAKKLDITKEEPQVVLRTDVPENAKWYVVHTYSGHENKVATNLKQRIDTMKLKDQIFDIIVPTRNIVTVKHGKKEEQKEKIFPGYILVRMILNDISWLAVRTTQGVTAFVGTGDKPTPISAPEVAAIMKFMALEAPKYKTSFSVGEAVKITDGPFSDFLGTIDSLDEEKGKVKVLVSIFGRETPVELDFLQVAKL